MTAALISEFASRPLIQKCVASPCSPWSVLSFWMGFDMASDKKEEILTSGSFVKEMQPLWFSGGPDFDKLCQKFSPVVRDAGKGILVTDDENNWDDVDGKLAQLILCDQLSRNSFRGSDEAFAYDDVSLDIARDLGSMALSDEPSFYGSYTLFLVLALMHAESLEDHKLGDKCIDKAIVTCPGIEWNNMRGFLLQHTKVIERFGRYPHRNAKKGRVSTKEEIDWLQSDDVPGWAKSQG